MATPQERKFAFSYVERGKQFVAAKQYPEALEALREAVRRDPTMVEAWILLASVHYTLGEDIECLGATEEALKHQSSSGAAVEFSWPRAVASQAQRGGGGRLCASDAD